MDDDNTDCDCHILYECDANFKVTKETFVKCMTCLTKECPPKVKEERVSEIKDFPV